MTSGLMFPLATSRIARFRTFWLPAALVGLGWAVLAGCEETAAPVDVCAIQAGDPDFEAVESRCDGIDNDCDGLTDVLQRVASNQCTTPALGACGSGHAGCNGLLKECLAPPPMPESKNSIDDDCDGAVDNVIDVTATTLARVTMPTDVWLDVEEGATSLNRDPILTAMEGLSQAGIAYDAPNPDNPAAKHDWKSAFSGDLSKYSLFVIPGYVDESFFKADETGLDPAADQLEKLRAWVVNGGRLVWIKPVAPFIDPAAPNDPHVAQYLDLAGIVTAVVTDSADTIAVTANVPATYYLDSPTERNIWLMARDPEAVSPEVITYVPDTRAGTQVFGTAMANGTPLGATWLRRPLGKGAVYTLGWDPLAEPVTLCDLNCFSPGRDIGVVMLRGIAQEAANGHAVWKHTVPGVESTVMIVTHDIDAPDSHNANPTWGEPGAVQSAKIEQELGIHGSYFVTTDYYVGYYNPELTGMLCDLDACPDAAHSVLHTDMSEMGTGDCTETPANYDPSHPNVCAEMQVSREILDALLPADKQIRAWRTPYLEPPPTLYSDLDRIGLFYDSSFSMGDAGGTLPMWIPRTPDMRDSNGSGRVFSAPLVEEDGIGDILSDGTQTRWELQKANADIFMGKWTWAFLENMNNNTWNTYLLHPSYGLGTNATNLAVKLGVMRRYLTRVLTYDMRVELFTAAMDFWRGRDGTKVESQYIPGKGYAGVIRVGPADAPRFSLEFGDNLAVFDCPSGGKVQIRGRRIVFETPLKAGTKHPFTATVQ